MLTLVSLLLAGFFAINKLYQKKFGTSLEKSMLFVCLSGAFMTVEFFIKTGFNVCFTPFSLIASALANLCEVFYTVIGFRLLKEGTMYAYTGFLMSGGMLLPFVFGICFLNEKAELLKIIGLVFILAGLVLSGTNGNKKDRIKFSHILLCCTVFIVNGFVSIISKVHQTQTVQQFCPRSEGRANTGNGRALVQGKGGGNIQHLVHIRTRSLCHTPPCISGQGIQIPPGAFGVQYAQSK